MINATLCAQMINFYITWLIVKQIFVRPAIALRDTILSSRTALVHQKEELLDTLQKIQDKKYGLWHAWYLQSRDAIHAKTTARYYSEPMSVHGASPEIPAQEIDKAVEQLSVVILAALGKKS